MLPLGCGQKKLSLEFACSCYLAEERKTKETLSVYKWKVSCRSEEIKETQPSSTGKRREANGVNCCVFVADGRSGSRIVPFDWQTKKEEKTEGLGWSAVTKLVGKKSSGQLAVWVEASQCGLILSNEIRCFAYCEGADKDKKKISSFLDGRGQAFLDLLVADWWWWWPAVRKRHDYDSSCAARTITSAQTKGGKKRWKSWRQTQWKETSSNIETKERKLEAIKKFESK